MNVKPSETGGLFSCERLLVVGANGAGKTWCAGSFGAACGLWAATALSIHPGTPIGRAVVSLALS